MNSSRQILSKTKAPVNMMNIYTKARFGLLAQSQAWKQIWPILAYKTGK